MAAPTPLRRRVATFALAYTTVFVSVLVVLAARIRHSEREAAAIVTTASAEVNTLRELQLEQSQFDLASRDRNAYEMLLRRSSGAVPAEIMRAMQSLFEDLGAEELPDLERKNSAIILLFENAIEQRTIDLERRVASLQRGTRNTLRAAFAALYLMLIGAVAVLKMTLDRIVRPLERLVDATSRVGFDEGEVRIPESKSDYYEVKELRLHFNRMVARIEAANAELRNRARTDELTSLPNFRHFRERIDAEIDRSSRYQHRFGLLVFDLDHFKSYNDEYGHLAGNEALQLVAQAIRAAMRSVDFCARYGGEEFAAVLPETEVESLGNTAERIRLSIAAIPPIEGRVSLTVSIGGATYPDDGTTAKELFARADARLYAAKEGGRNRVVVS